MKKIKTLSCLSCLFILFACGKNDLFDHDKNLSFSENLQQLADSYVEWGFPGMVFLVDHPDKGLHIIESGEANTEEGTKISKDHLFHSASLMKVYTGVCIYMLEEQGLLNTNDLIKDHLSAGLLNDIPNGNEATIKQLLNHSSGIPDFASQDDYINDLLAFVEGGEEPNEELSYIKGLTADFSVGSKNSYSNTGPYILHLIVASVSGQDFPTFLHQNIIEPLGLEHTFYGKLPSEVDYDRVPNYYIDWDDNGNLSNSTNLENSVTQTFEGYSGLLASIEDYHTFMKALFQEGTLLNNTSINKMKAISHDKDFGYGQGLEVILSKKYPDKYGHKGGTQASSFYYPDEDCIVITLINYSFLSGNSPFDKKGIALDKIGENKNLVGEIERCMFK